MRPRCNREAAREAAARAQRRLPNHPHYEHDPTVGLIEPWSTLMGYLPTHVVWIKEFSTNPGETVFPYLAWDVADPSWPGGRETTCLWHGTRPEAALAIANAGYRLVPGPRRQQDGRRTDNLDKTYCTDSVALAAQYAAPPMVAGTSGDRTASCGAMVIFQCEPSTPAAGAAVAKVGKLLHPAKLSKPRVLQMMVRFDWRRGRTQDSRIYNLRQGFHNGDCALPAHKAAVADPAALQAAAAMAPAVITK